MPIQYSSVKDESNAIRKSIGVFDVSHMGEFFVEGKDATAFIDHILTNDFKNTPVGKALYSPLCRENGTVIDDLIAYKLEDELSLICVNAANIEKDWSWISAQTGEFDIKLTNQSDQYQLLAVQGPDTAKVLSGLEFSGIDAIPYYGAAKSTWQGSEVILARTGYTGEDGFEIFADHQTIVTLWDKLMAAEVVPCGLAARDVLRLEVCYPLYGHEINDEVTPLDAALKWTVKMDKDNFIGKDALTGHTSEYRLVKLSLDKGIPREGYEILDESEKVIGVVTSGTMSVALSRGIALGHVRREFFPENKKFFIRVRKNIIEAQYHAKPFITGGHK
jgi:aminomethyltransferase